GVGAALRLAERDRGDRRAGGEPRDPVVADLRSRRAEDRVAAEPLQREGGLGLRTAVGQAFPQLAQLRGRASEHPREQAVFAERADEWPIHPPFFAGSGDRRQSLVAEAPCSLEELTHPG